MGTKVIERPSGGPRGRGSIVVLNDTQVRVTITDREDKTIEKVLDFSQGVANVQIQNWQLQSADDLSISLTEDQLDFLYTPRPRNGTFHVEFSRFGAEEGELPTIRHDDKKDYDGKPWLPERYKMFALYEIIDPGPYQGMEILDSPTYEWEWDENLEEMTIVASKRKKFHAHAMVFLNVFGYDLQHDNLHYTGEQYDAGGDITIPNVLPELEDILRARKKLAQVTVVNGWVQEDGIQPASFGMTKDILQTAFELQEKAI